jgi:hypothetical protein
MLPPPWDISAHLDLEFAAAIANSQTSLHAAPYSASPPKFLIDPFGCISEHVLKHLPQGSAWLGVCSASGTRNDVRPFTAQFVFVL